MGYRQNSEMFENDLRQLRLSIEMWYFVKDPKLSDPKFQLRYMKWGLVSSLPSAFPS